MFVARQLEKQADLVNVTVLNIIQYIRKMFDHFYKQWKMKDN